MAKFIALTLLLLSAACAHETKSDATQVAPVMQAEQKAPQTPPTISLDPNGAAIQVLVMPLHAEASLQNSAHALDEMILAAIGHFQHYQVMGPDDLNAMLGVEKLKDAMGCDDVSCATEIGGALGAPYILTGELTRLGEEVVLSLRLLDVQKAHLMARGTARGGLNADELTNVMSEAVSEAFNIKVSNVVHVRSEQSAQTPPATGLTYQTVMTQLSKRTANKDYAGAMQDLDSYDTQTISAPPGTDVREALTFWRSFVCYMAQKSACVVKAATEYQAHWPDGIYASTVKSYADQLALLDRQRDAREQQLQALLEQFEAKRRTGQLSDDQALEMSANAAVSLLAYQRAAGLFERLMERAKNDEQRWFMLVERRAMALEEAQAYAQARAVLQEAQARNNALFQSRGLGVILARLPP